MSDDAGATREDDVGDDPDAFVGFVRGEDRVAAAADEFLGMFEIEEEGTEAVDPGIRDAVIDDEPAGGGFDRYGVDADFLAIPHAAAREKERSMREKLGAPIKIERGECVDINSGLNTVEDVVFSVDFFREKTRIFVVDTWRRNEDWQRKLIKALREEILFADGRESDTRRFGWIDGSVEKIGGAVENGDARVLTAGVSRDGFLFEREARSIDRIWEA